MGKYKSYLSKLRKFDYFGVNLTFNIRKHEFYQTKFGGFIFIMFCFIAAAYSSFSFVGYITFSNFNVAYNRLTLDKAPVLNFTQFDLAVAIGLTVDNDASFNKELYSLFDINFTHVVYDKVKGKTKTPFPLKPCTYQSLFNLANYSFDVNKLDQLFCPDLKNFTIGGVFTDPWFAYFDYSVNIKPSAMNNITGVQNFFKYHEVIASFFSLDSTIDTDNYAEPVSKFLTNYFMDLDFSYKKSVNLNFMFKNFSSDSNPLYQNFQYTDSIILGDSFQYSQAIGDTRFTDKNPSYQTFGKMFIRSSLNMEITYRTYQKLTDFIANMTGILSQILLIIFICMQEINMFMAKQSIMKKIMKFRDNMRTKEFDTIGYLKKKFMQDSIYNN